MQTTATASTSNLAGKYLTFVLGREYYGIPILKVKEIIRLSSVTAVPQMPSYVKGVINLRGKIIPVIDLCLKFSMNCLLAPERACIVVVQVRGAGTNVVQLGLAVDAVEEVCQFSDADIEPPPDFGAAIDTAYILGMAKAKGTVKTLLDIDRVLGARELAAASLASVGPDRT